MDEMMQNPIDEDKEKLNGENQEKKGSSGKEESEEGEGIANDS